MNIEIIHVTVENDVAVARELFLEYARSLDFNLCFQNFEKELAGLPGDYVYPSGMLLICKVDGKPAGCIAIHKIDVARCEMKRLYVRQNFRNLGLGRKLTCSAIDEGKKIGYSKMLLDTVPSMKEAIRLYKKLGFKEIKPYRNNPVEGAIFMELDL